MSATKRFVEKISEEMGLDGEITPEVLRMAERRLRAQQRASAPDLLRPAIRSRMAERQMTPRDLARDCGIGYDNIRRYLLGERGLNDRSINAVLHTLGLSVRC